MEFYKIEKEKLIKTASIPWDIIVLSSDEFKNSIFYDNYIHHSKSYLKYSKFEVYPSYIFFSISIPSKQKLNKNTVINMYINKNSIIFVDSCDYVINLISKINKFSNTDITLSRFIYLFLSLIIEKDMLFIDKTEERLSSIEEDILKGNIENFNDIISIPKKRLFIFYRFYNNMLDICESFDSQEHLFVNTDEIGLIPLLTARVARLKSETGYLKEYVQQIQGIYQTQIAVRQNDIMKVLTIVTTVVLPLSLIAGWYGMNFKYMPELFWKYGYYYVIILSAAVILICLMVFKNKKYF